MRVIHVITTIDRGGAENAVLLLAKLQRKQHEVTVVPLKGSGELRNDFEKAGITCDLTLMNRPFIYQCFILTRNYGKKLLFHGHLPRAEMLLAVSKRASNFFVTRHNAEPFFPGAPAILSRVLSNFVTKKARGVVAISQTVRNYLIENREVSPNKLSVIYYGYQPVRNPLSNASNDLRSNTSLKLVCVSRLAPQKNLHFLLRLMQSLQDDKVDSSLDIYGTGSKLIELQEFARSLNLSNVKFCGKIEKVVEVLMEYDVFILTSRYEGFGLVLLEAMDASIPIVAPRVSAIPEVLGVNHMGLFEPENLSECKSKLFQILYSSSKSKELVNLQRSRLSFFSSVKYFASHELLYATGKLD